MEKHQANIKYKLFSCAIALSLVFGLSAVPAFAVPDASDPSSEVAAQSEPAETSVPEESTIEAVNPDSSWGEPIKEELQEGNQPEEELSPLDTAATLVGAEVGLMVDNVSDGQITVQEDGESGETGKKSEIVAAVRGSKFGHFGSYDSASMKIIKAFGTYDTIVTAKKSETKNYTVSYEITGYQATKDGDDVYEDGQGNLFKQTNAGLADSEGRLMYTVSNDTVPNGKLFSKDSNGLIHDTDTPGDIRRCLSMPDKPVQDADGNNMSDPVYVVQNQNSIGYVYKDWDGNSFFYYNPDSENPDNLQPQYINIEQSLKEEVTTYKGILSDNEDTYVELAIVDLALKDDKKLATGNGVERKQVYKEMRELVNGAELSSGFGEGDRVNQGLIEIEKLPYPAKYTIEELPSSYYTFISVDLEQNSAAWLLSKKTTNPVELLVAGETSVQLAFTNHTIEDTPNTSASGIVNRYQYNNEGKLTLNNDK